jgi:hypothetical protein
MAPLGCLVETRLMMVGFDHSPATLAQADESGRETNGHGERKGRAKGEAGMVPQ